MKLGLEPRRHDSQNAVWMMRHGDHPDFPSQQDSVSKRLPVSMGLVKKRSAKWRVDNVPENGRPRPPLALRDIFTYCNEIYPPLWGGSPTLRGRHLDLILCQDLQPITLGDIEQTGLVLRRPRIDYFFADPERRSNADFSAVCRLCSQRTSPRPPATG